MKVCPKCNTRYSDENLNFCLNDGELLTNFGDVSLPTTVLEASRVTNQTNWNAYETPQTATPAPWQSQHQNIQNQSYGVPAFNQSLNQTLPTVSLVLGVLALLLTCCFGGFPLGLAALITGFLGMKNVNDDPSKYGGRGLAIGGFALGIISILISIVYILISILAN